MKHFVIVLAVGILLVFGCRKEEPKTLPEKHEAIAQKEEPKTGAMLIAEGKEKLTEAKKKLAQEDKYDCCIEDDCDYCALHEGSCSCASDLKKGDHVCLECYAGWQQGKGDVPNIKKENVTTSLLKHEHHH
ncbi:MAG: hypothetical protein HYR76_10050 [Ignavibacteria bacterium]|nr:hypothetical protein [Ignavibacteria bacterium]MBI3764966.1 hypothetical protein [Ignavibacteriales bacterium]